MIQQYFTVNLSEHKSIAHHLAQRGWVAIQVEAPDWQSARDVMMSHFGRQWGFQYDERPAEPVVGYVAWGSRSLDVVGAFAVPSV